MRPQPLSPGHGAHADLWQRLNVCISRDPQRVCFAKVKGHATWRDVEMNRETHVNKVGNARADALAREGSDLHTAILPLVHSCLRRRRMTRDYHKILHDILIARDRALAALPTHITDPPVQVFRARVAMA